MPGRSVPAQHWPALDSSGLCGTPLESTYGFIGRHRIPLDSSPYDSVGHHRLYCAPLEGSIGSPMRLN
eukprot:2916866-Pyramimonas_sp.AAC.1